MKIVIKIGEDSSHVILPDNKTIIINRDDENISAVQEVLEAMGHNVKYENFI